MTIANLRTFLGFASIAFLASCGADRPLEPSASVTALAPATKIPLMDQVTGTYQGFARGLYGGTNSMPKPHDTEGIAAARRIRPLDANGAPSASGKIVLLSVGVSSASQEFCGKHSTGGVCNSWTFAGRAMPDPQKTPALVLVNGADGGQQAPTWESPGSANYVRVRGELAAQGVTDRQVQVIWLKVVNIAPQVALPSPSADAYNLQRSMGNILRTLKIVYPNLQQVFVSSRIYAGYTTANNNPEPYAYESGFAVKWLIGAQVKQMKTGTVDPIAGNLDYRTVAPWVAWGPYMWASGTTPRSDGLTWIRSEFETDGFHPNTTGETKVGQFLFNFFTQSRHTGCWYHGTPC